MSLKLFVYKVGNIKLMSSNEILTKENTLQHPPQFPSTSGSESESETEMNSIKIGK